jgi:hypothetical protein
VLGTLEITDSVAQAAILDWRRQRRRPLGVSMVFRGEGRPLRFTEDDVWTFFDRITDVRAVDLVSRPMAGGRVLGIVTGRPRSRGAEPAR